MCTIIIFAIFRLSFDLRWLDFDPGIDFVLCCCEIKTDEMKNEKHVIEHCLDCAEMDDILNDCICNCSGNFLRIFVEDYFEGIFFRGNFLEEVFERNFSGEIFGFC